MQIRTLILIVIFIVIAPMACSPDNEEIITLKALSYGFEKTRLENLEAAALVLNQELKDQGIKKTVVIQSEFDTGEWDDYRKRLITEFNDDDGPDIFISAHEDIGWLAAEGYILPLDDLRSSDAYENVYNSLWTATIWNGRTWGVPQDTDISMILVNRRILKSMGWMDKQIESLPDLVRSGEFTMSDLTSLASRAVTRGASPWGIVHRPVNGQFFYMMNEQFDVHNFYSVSGTIEVKKDQLVKSLTYYYNLTQVDKVTPMDVTLSGWEKLYEYALNDQVLFYFGANWSIFDFVVEADGEREELLEKFIYIMYPAIEKGGQPITVSHPLLYTIGSQTTEVELAKRLLEIVSAPIYQVRHALETEHLPIDKVSAEAASFKADPYLSSLMYMLDYAIFLPNDEKYTIYSSAYFKAVQKVETGMQTPDEAALDMIIELTKKFGDKIIFK